MKPNAEAAAEEMEPMSPPEDGEAEAEGAGEEDGEGEDQEDGEAEADGEGDEDEEDDGEGEGDEDEDGEEQQQQGKHRKPGAEKRIAKLTATIYGMKAENQELKAMMAQLIEQTKPAPQPLPPRPQHADFDTDEEYEDALFDWREMKKERAAQEKNPKQPQAPQGHKGANGQPAQDPSKVQAYQAQAAAARTKYTDFDQVVNNPTLMVSDAMVGLLLKNKNGAELAYWLGKRPNESARIALLPADEVAVEIGKIAGRLESLPAKPAGKKKAPEPPASAKPSKAPAPMTPVGGKAPAVKDPSKMTMEEYAKHINAKERKRNGR
jgi:hypothetical protein